MTILIIILIVIGGIVGYRRGGILQFLHFFGTLSAIIIARLNYKQLGDRLDLIMPYPSSVSEVNNIVFDDIANLEQAYYYISAFLIIFIVSKIIIQIVISVFDYINQIIFDKKTSKIVGTVLGIIECLYILAIVLFFIGTVPSTTLQQMVGNSSLATFIIDHTLFISGKLKDWSQI